MHIPRLSIIAAALTLVACDPNVVVNDVVGLASLPRVCPSSVRAIVANGSIEFLPSVQNRGVSDSNTPFTVSLKITYRGGVRGLPFAGPTSPLIGTHAVPGVTGGPEVELSTTTNLTSRWFPYDPQEIYGVESTVHSSDSTFNTANEDCHTLTEQFRGGSPI